ncbi:pyrimidine reductase family protein [Actinoplanes sp. NPDC051633]|uniref:pyrimidine reductase family protein n=1 Tax=Actinoplanes sp. NPDC051633 TaxID=3155670 RepID=UPI00343AF614
MTITRLRPSPAGPVALEELPELYPRRDEPVLRVNFVSSLDGAATLDGHSGGLGDPTDQEILKTLRTVCDALVVGAATVRGENYDGLRLDPSRRAWREERGLPAYPLMVVVSRSLDLDLDQLVFADAPRRPVVLAGGGTAKMRRQVERVADVVATDDLAAGIAALHERGATQVFCEGGPRLLGALLEADLVDELCLTVSPLLTAGDASRIAHGGQAVRREMSLRHILAEEDMLFLRYARR